MKLFCGIFCVFVTTIAAQNETDLIRRSPNPERTLGIVCSRALPLTNREVELYCCYLQSETFQAYWYYGGYYLSRHLEMLRTWRCPQLQTECQQRIYGFSEFTRLTYERFCNKSHLEETCTPVLQDAVESNSNPATESRKTMSTDLESSGSSPQQSEWNDLIERLDPASLPKEKLTQPCVQVAQMDTYQFGDYVEILSADVPFCSMVWCGTSREAIEKGNDVSVFDCMPKICQVNVYIMMTVVILLGVAVVVANIIVIVVFATTPKLQNSQAILKISLAAADLLIGLVVLPSFAVNLSKKTMKPATIGDIYEFKMKNFSHPFVDWNQVPMPGRDGESIIKATGFFIHTFDSSYQYAIGCITTISFLVSIYTLMIAGFDRLLAVYKPLQYRRHNSKKIALRLAISMWLIAIIFSLIPFMSNLKYGLVSTMLFTMVGPLVYIVYIIVFLVPLVLVWITNIMVYVTVRSHARKRQEMATHSFNQASETEAEHRLTVTLSIIVGIFTLSALPATITSILPVFVSDINPREPSTYDVTIDTVFHSVDFVAVVILMCNSLWNCFIYSARNRDFKKATKELYKNIRRSCKTARTRRESKNFRKNRGSKTNTRTTNTTLRTTSTKTTSNINTTSGSPSKKSSPEVEAKIDKIEEQRSREDSVFQSFSIDANTDRFFNSVMGRVDSLEKDDTSGNDNDKAFTPTKNGNGQYDVFITKNNNMEKLEHIDETASDSPDEQDDKL